MALTDKFAEALVFAAKLHAEQTRKGTDIPYVSHLLGVASLVLEHEGTEAEAIAGLLHDAIEDQAHDYPGGAQQLRQAIADRFGVEVLAIVDGCTDADTVPKPPWRARKEAYIAHLAEASPAVLRVSCADKLHNARAIMVDLRTHGGRLWQRFTAGRDGTLWYYRALVSAFEAAGAPVTLVDELGRIVQQIEDRADGQTRLGTD